MGDKGCARQRMWRWRRNPLRRRSDVVEAWIVLVVWFLVVVGGVLAGLVVSDAADRAFAEQRAERRPTRAVLLTDVPRADGSADSPRPQGLARVRWTTGAGTERTDEAMVDRGLKAGAEVTLWLDRAGDPATRPPSASEAAWESGALGTAAGLALAGLVFGAGAAARWRLGRNSAERWGQEWELVEPEWRRQHN
ncbi:hypothetical protein [Streptomyces sp. NPDC048002]|uniref:Rv1733c family protein n=1 Tax=unclassified Streptomyces TaxID=2593676 RepID=UPI0033D845DA